MNFGNKICIIKMYIRERRMFMKKVGRPSTSVQVECRNCHKQFRVKPSRIEREKCCSKKCSLEYLKQHGMSDEVKRKISDAKGGVKTEKRTCLGCGIEFEVQKWSKKTYHNRQCSCRTIGKRSHYNIWNKGLTLNDSKLKSLVEKQIATLKARYANGEIKVWNKGLTAETDDRVSKMVELQKAWRNSDGPEKEKWRESMRRGQVKAHADGKYPHTFTEPEKLTWSYLELLHFIVKEYKDKDITDSSNTWYHQYPFVGKFVPDFACPDLKCVIEVNGCYMHGHNPSRCTLIKEIQAFAQANIKRDRRKRHLYHRQGWKWAEVWECEAKVGDFHRLHTYLGL